MKKTIKKIYWYSGLTALTLLSLIFLTGLGYFIGSLVTGEHMINIIAFISTTLALFIIAWLIFFDKELQ